MAKDPRKRQQKLMKQRRKAKEKKKRAARTSTVHSESALIRRARSYPIHECLINEEWQEQSMAQILVARRQSEGMVLFGVYVVDLGCLGVKDAFAKGNVPMSEYRDGIRHRLVEESGAKRCPVELAHQIVYGALDYADALDFEPHKDFKMARHVLEERESISPNDDIEFGKDGKPFYCAGPHDHVEKIMQHLEDRLGSDGFHFITPALEMQGEDEWDDWE